MLRDQTAWQYNEVILDSAPYLAELPYSLEAIIGDAAIHAAFLEAFGISADDVPLVAFHPKSGFSRMRGDRREHVG